MKCIVCGKPTRVLATRDEQRTRECSGNPAHRRKTIEVDARLLHNLTGLRADKAVASIRKGAHVSAKAAERRRIVGAETALGKTPKQIAEQLGCSAHHVRKLVRDLGKLPVELPKTALRPSWWLVAA